MGENRAFSPKWALGTEDEMLATRARWRLNWFTRAAGWTGVCIAGSKVVKGDDED